MGMSVAWFILVLEFLLISSLLPALEMQCFLLADGRELLGRALGSPRGSRAALTASDSIEAISRRGSFQRGQQGVSCSVLWSPCEGPPCLRDAISIQAACHRRERFHLDFWKLAAG